MDHVGHTCIRFPFFYYVVRLTFVFSMSVCFSVLFFLQYSVLEFFFISYFSALSSG